MGATGFVPYVGQMIANVTYRRPEYVTQSSRSSSMDLTRTPSKSSSTKSQGIPEALAFDKIINGGTCPPMTIREFMNYLQYVEHAPENLQFFLWYRDYSRRFEQTTASQNPFSTPPATIGEFSGISFDSDYGGTQTGQLVNQISFNTEKTSVPKTTTVAPWERMSDSESDTLTQTHSATQGSYRATAEQVFAQTGIKPPAINLPYRDEIDRIITLYIADNGSRQLNLSSRQRRALLVRLSTTTHPSAFQPVVETVEASLRYQAHPNFVRWSISNGNKPRQIFAKTLGFTTFIFGFIYAILVTLSNLNRGWRAFGAIFWVVGSSTVYASFQGMCVVLHGLHRRHLRPWELWESEESVFSLDDKASGSGGSKNQEEDYPWIKKYDKRFIVRKVFDREAWVQEPALRQIQDIIFLQSLLIGFAVGGILTLIFLAVPSGGFF